MSVDLCGLWLPQLHRRATHEFRHVQTHNDVGVVRSVRGPKVVLATLPTMTAGFAQQLFLDWAGDRRNLVRPQGCCAGRCFSLFTTHALCQILFTTRPPAGTLGSKVLATPREVVVKGGRRVPLRGAELAEFQRMHRPAVKVEEDEDSHEDEVMSPVARTECVASKARFPMYSISDPVEVVMTDYGIVSWFRAGIVM